MEIKIKTDQIPFFYNIYGIIYIRLLDGFKMKSIPFHIIRNKDKPSIDAIIIFK